MGRYEDEYSNEEEEEEEYELGINEDFLKCVNDVPNNAWEYHKGKIGWILAKPQDVSIDCQKGNKHLLNI